MRDHALIGNGQASALVNDEGTITWLCLPRPDSPPVFGQTLDPAGGAWSIAAPGARLERQAYRTNTAILESDFVTPEGDRYRITDFLPRFRQHGRMYRPLQVVRIITPLDGLPRVIVDCQPVAGWSREALVPRRGSSHLRWDRAGGELRLTTDLPLTPLMEGRPLLIDGPRHLVMSWDLPMEADLAPTCRDFLERTTDHWHTWVKRCSIPQDHQAQVIRSAITLKLHCFEETGAVLAAPTTSLPETPGEERNWDYRFCWLRDAWFTVSALSRLGHLDDLEGLMGFLMDRVRSVGPDGRLAPVYRIDGTLPLPEIIHPAWAGAAGSQPVRSGNQAAEHVQNDVYGEMLLTLATLFRDERLAHLRDHHRQGLLTFLAERCRDTLGESDAGLWELRGGWKAHAFPTLLSWAGLRTYERLCRNHRVPGPIAPWTRARRQSEHLLQRSVADGVLWNAPGDRVPDASLALAVLLDHPDRALCRRTLATITRDLEVLRDGHKTGFFFRYRYPDDFGSPQHAFVVCSFWIAEAHARLGQMAEGRRIFRQALQAANHVGLMAEHWDPQSGTAHGNFPQCYSHVGLIGAAFALSPTAPLLG